MAAPSYATDLAAISSGDETTGYSEPTGATIGALTRGDTDFFIQGAGCCSKTSGVGLAGAIYDAGSAKTIPTDGAVFVWLFFAATSTLDTEAGGGLRVIIGSATSAFRHWYVKGVDTYAYGGWFCVPVDPTVAGNEDTGSPSMSSLRYFGCIADVPGPGYASKGNPLGLDAIRYGRGESRISGGDLANGYAIFGPAPNGYAAYNDNSSNRWGLIQAMAPGVHSAGYQVQGLVIFGYGSAVDFRDANTSINILDTKKVSANFNTFEVRNASSRVDLTAISFVALGTTSRGRWITTDNADINIDACTFTDMDTFIFLSNSTINNSTFRRTGQITQNTAVFDGCLIDNNRAATAMIVNDITKVTNTKFVSDGTGYAIEGFSAAGSYTLTGLTFTGYGADGTTNAAVHVTATTGTVTLNISGGSTPTYKSDGATVVVVNTKSLTLSGLVTGSDIVIRTAGTETVLESVDAHGSTSYVYSYVYASGTYIDVDVYKPGYMPFLTIRNYLLPNSNGSLPVSQVVDTSYVE